MVSVANLGFDIGDARTLYTIQTSGTTSDGQGGQVAGTPVTVGTVWGIEIFRTGRDIKAAERVSSRNTVQVRCWNYPGLTTKHWLLDGSRKLLIHAVENVNRRNEEMMLTCEEIQQ